VCGVSDAIAEDFELVLGDGCFDEGEELVFLESDVAGEPGAEIVQQLERRCSCEPGGVATDQHVVQERADDRGVIRLAVCGVGREQELFLEAEVQLLFGLPVGEKSADGLGRRLGCRAAQEASDHKRVMVIARERDEGGVAFHAGRRGSPRAVTTRTKSRQANVTAWRSFGRGAGIHAGELDQAAGGVGIAGHEIGQRGVRVEHVEQAERDPTVQ